MIFKRVDAVECLRTHKVLAASVVLAAGLLYGCSDSEVNEGEAPDPDPVVESGVETQAIKVNNNPADFADRITLYGGEAGSRAAADGELSVRELALIASPETKGLNLSATCIYPHDGRAYVCYHLNEGYDDNKDKTNKHQGAVELIKYDENQPMIHSQLTNEKSDFNHCILDPNRNRMYTVGDTKNGASLGVIDVDLNYKFTQKDNMNALKLGEGSGNCVDRNGNYLRIATTAGFYTAAISDLDNWSVNKLESSFAMSDSEKAKHIASDATGERTFTLHLRGVNSSNDRAAAVIRKGWGAEGTELQTAYTITPTNGKNTIAVDNISGDIYVCLGEDGVVKLDENGNKKGSYRLQDTNPDYKGFACANGVAVDENYVYIAYGGYGLVVLDKDMNRLARYAHKEKVTDANGNETVKAIYSANYVALDGEGLIYVAYGRNGLGILKLDK